MLIVREVFIAKPGQASKLAAMMKELWPDARVMTDVSGVFNKVVMETEIENLDHFEKRMGSYRNNTQGKGPMKSYTEMYTQGKREFYRVW